MSGTRIQQLLVSPAFARLWAAISVAGLGETVTGFVLPVIAVIVLDATPTEVGILVLLQQTPVFVLGLFAGVWLDRQKLRRVLLITCSVHVGLLVSAVLILASWPSMNVLYGLGLLLGVVTLMLDLGHTGILPAVVERSLLVTGNSRIQVSGAAIGAVGPAIAGVLTKALFPPLVLLLSAVSALAAVICLRLVPEVRAPEPASREEHFFRRMWEGMQVLFRNRLLRPLVASSCCGALAAGGYSALMVITVTRELGLDTAALGLMVASGSVATAIGAALAPRISNRIGMGRAVLVGNLFTTSGFLAIAISAGTGSVGMMVASFLAIGTGLPLYGVNQISIRQAVTPREVLSRVNASRRVVVFMFMPVGALLGGMIADASSISVSLYLATGAMVASTAVVFFSALNRQRLRFEELVSRA